jgi:hypothetical protein
MIETFAGRGEKMREGGVCGRVASTVTVRVESSRN